MLLASRLDAGRADDAAHERVDLLLLAAEEGTHVGAQVHGEPLAVVGDERLLRRALRNLLDNAHRYGGGSVEARAVRAAGGDGGGILSVCDRGRGVPEAMRERVFEPFFRLPGHAEQSGGVGLGL